MAPLTCKVVDTSYQGLPGVHVIIDGRDQLYRSITKLESLIDDDGEITIWFPLPSVGRSEAIAPQIVDTAMLPRVSLTFFPQGNFTTPLAPWLSIHTDLYLPGNEWHGVTLCLGQAPRLEYSPYPVANPLEMMALGLYKEPAVPNAQIHESTPSPLLLPSPIRTSPHDDKEPEEDGEAIIMKSTKYHLHNHQLQPGTLNRTLPRSVMQGVTVTYVLLLRLSREQWDATVVLHNGALPGSDRTQGHDIGNISAPATVSRVFFNPACFQMSSLSICMENGLREAYHNPDYT
ncbi:hypothetical protein HRG_012523 [Hirsutella rhossiliensis]